MAVFGILLGLLLVSVCNEAAGCRGPIVEILVSPVVDENTIRILDIAWDVGGHFRNGDWIGLYREPPTSETKPVFRANVNQNAGSVKTGIQEGRKQPKPHFGKTCLGWWTAYWHLNNPQPVAVSCLGTNPRWMEENCAIIGNMKINNMFIPGTHDSGAYHDSYAHFIDNRVNKYTYTQDESILEQLIHGARLLDLRVALQHKQFWVNHGVISIHPLDLVLNEIKKFVDSTKEIVVLDFHEISGLKTPQDHDMLIQFIKSKLGNHMAPVEVGWGVTLNHLWSINKRVIVAYNNKEIANDRSRGVFWPVNQLWGNKQTLHDLFHYFAGIFRGFNNGGIFSSAMAEMTPLPLDAVFDTLKGLRVMAENSNKDITAWFRGDWGRTVNGVSVDFLRSTGIVDAAIRWNLRRAKGKTCD